MPICTARGCPKAFVRSFRLISPHHLVNFRRRSDGSYRIILMGPGKTKQGHNLIPGKLLDSTMIPDNHLGHLPDKRANEVF